MKPNKYLYSSGVSMRRLLGIVAIFAMLFPPHFSYADGNGNLGTIYDNTMCGLNYTTASQRLGQRFSPIGISQPAPFVISGIPGCGKVEKAFLWAEGSGNGAPQTATISGPSGTLSFPMSLVGSQGDKCWGYSGSHTYRADVTSVVSGNGTYNISGLLTGSPNDMDGATLMVIYTDGSVTYQGRIIIADGAIERSGGVANQVINYAPVCGPTQNASAFIGIGDLQFNGTAITVNGTPAAYSFNWWNYIEANTVVLPGQTSSSFSVNAAGDCYNVAFAGLYYRTTTCAACAPAAIVLNTSSTPSGCNPCNGTATVTTPGGQGPFTYSWAPSGGNAATATGLCPGTYTVTVTSACGSSSATVTVALDDHDAPVPDVAILPDATGECSATATAPTATDVCAGSITGTTTDPTTYTTQGTYTITWTYDDGNGNTSTQTQNVVVDDITAPVPDVAALPTVTGDCSASIESAPTATDNCVGAVTGTTTDPLSYNAEGTYTVNWTYSDGNGNSSTQNQTVIVHDTQKPTITAPANVVINGWCVNTTANLGSPTVSDNCNAYTVTNNAPATYPVGTTTVTWTITDAGGNSASATQTVTVNPAVVNVSISVSPNPTVANQQAFTIFLGYGPQSVTLTASASGGTAPYTYSWSPVVSNSASVLVSPTVTTTYTVTVTDAHGCTKTATQKITAKDVRDGNKIFICHIPPGNPGNPQTISVSANAVPAHLAHGDNLGACPAAKMLNNEENASAEANELNFRVYPNPTSGLFTIELPATGDVDVVITDVTGKLISRESVKDNKEQHMHINLGNVANGLYFIRVLNAGNIYQSKITKQ